MTEVLLLMLKLAVAASIFAIGLGATPADLRYILRRPGLMLRSLVAMYLLVPLVALALVQWLPVAPEAKAAMLVLAVSAGAPLLPKKLGALDSDEYVFSLLVASSLLAIAWVPAWVGLMGNFFGIGTTLTPAGVASVLAKAFLLPLTAGMLLRWSWPRCGGFSSTLLLLAGAVLAVAGLLLLVLHWNVLLAAGAWSFVALVLLLGIALLIGHLAGGPGRDERTSLAIACATRHIGIALLVASAFPGPGTATLVAAYVVASLLVSVPYLLLRKRAARLEPG